MCMNSVATSICDHLSQNDSFLQVSARHNRCIFFALRHGRELTINRDSTYNSYWGNHSWHKKSICVEANIKQTDWLHAFCQMIPLPDTHNIWGHPGRTILTNTIHLSKSWVENYKQHSVSNPTSLLKSIHDTIGKGNLDWIGGVPGSRNTNNKTYP